MSWKTNVESLAIVEIPLTPEYVRWANEAAHLNGIQKYYSLPYYFITFIFY